MRHDQKIKPLVWEGPRETDGLHQAYDAYTPIGTYIASMTDEGKPFAFRVGHGSCMYPSGDTIEDAKAAAQVDFEARIREWLKP